MFRRMNGSTLFALAIMTPLLIFSCKQSEKLKPPSETTDKAPLKVAAPGREFQAQRLWDEKCKWCHSQEQLHGKTATDISRALVEVRVMRRIKDLSDQDIEALGVLLSGEAEPEQYVYITPEACRTCHPSHFEQWSHSMHALAHIEPVYDYYFIKASMESDQKLEPFCASCHTPIGVFNRSIPFPQPVRGPKDTAVSDVEDDGVQCDFCHLIKTVRETNNAGYVVKASRTKFGPYQDSVSTFHDTEYSALHKSAELCGACHNVSHPINGIVLESTYTEWKQSPYAKEGVVCQDCHMTRGLTKRVEQPGKASPLGPDRGHVSEHFFVGPNLLFSNLAAAKELRTRSEQLLRSAGKVEIGEPEKKDEVFSVPVMVTNTGAGHYLPTGITEIRQLWLEVKVTDDSGTLIMHSGGLDPDGNILGSPTIFFTNVIDEMGNSTTRFWNTVYKLSDHRIPPRQTVTEIIDIPLTDKVEQYSVEVALQYRSVPPRGLAEVGAPPGLVDIPVFTISESTKHFTDK